MTTDKKIKCPICDYGPQPVETEDYGKILHLRCPRCGEFKITCSAANKAKDRGISGTLSAWTRNRSEQKAAVPEVNNLNLDEIASNFPAHSVSDKQTLLLEALARRSKFPGSGVPIDASLDYPLIWAINPHELEFHLKNLVSRDLVRYGNQMQAIVGNGPPECVLTADGWTYLDSVDRPRSIKTQAFVAMSFDNTLNSAWLNGIEPAVRRAGYKPFRTDAQPSIDRIDVRIMTEIRRSNLLIADVTLQRPGVYFEAGYAIGLGIPVYWCVRSDDRHNVHFDTRQYNHIIWNDPVDFSEKLYNFIYAISGPGPGAAA